MCKKYDLPKYGPLTRENSFLLESVDFTMGLDKPTGQLQVESNVHKAYSALGVVFARLLEHASRHTYPHFPSSRRQSGL